MWAVGTYERFLRRIKGQDNIGKVDLFGILIVDGRQHEAQEYILNYMDVFNTLSSSYINFYVPGYFQDTDEFYVGEGNNRMEIGNKVYIFNSKEYIKFCKRFECDFNIPFPFVPTLVLLEYHSGHFDHSKKIIIELDGNIKKSGELFRKIFDFAKQNKDLSMISKSLSKEDRKKILSGGVEVLLGVIGIDLEPVIDPYRKVKSFRVRK